MEYDFLIVGAGFFGAVLAERIANVLGKSVLILDKRDHIGGNCYSEIDEITGIEYHKYGTHIFHTKKNDVWSYINDFTNNSLGGFLQRENVNDCFEHYGPANVAKLQCYLYNNTFHMKNFFCLFLIERRF